MNQVGQTINKLIALPGEMIAEYKRRRELEAQLETLTDHHFLDVVDLVHDLENSHPDGKPLFVTAAGINYLRKKRQWD